MGPLLDMEAVEDGEKGSVGRIRLPNLRREGFRANGCEVPASWAARNK